MGSITRSFANNITTSGVLLPASLTNNSIANVTAYNAAVATGNMVLLSSQTASASASISFTTGINSTYKEYQFYFINVKVATDGADLRFQGSTDSGSNYGVVATDSYFQAYHSESDSTATLDYDTGRDLAQSTAFSTLTNGVKNNSDNSLNGILQIFNPSSTTYVKHYISRFSSDWDGIGEMDTYKGGYFNTTSAINAIRFQMNAGNIADGTILMYGIV